MVEFSDLKYKSSSNFKTIRWKLTILEIRPMLTFWSKWTWKRIGHWIQWPYMKSLFKFHVNRMKIEDFRNTALVVVLGPMLTFWSMLISKTIGWLNSLTWNVNPLQISSQLDENWGIWKSHLSCWPLAYVDLLTSKIK